MTCRNPNFGGPLRCVGPLRPLRHLHLLCAAALALAAAGALAQVPAATLSAPASRISDPVIAADMQTYEAMQARLRAINAGGRPLRDYALSKAQCWLDVSFHEYTRNDRGPFPQEALRQAELLVQGMEAGRASGAAALGADTLLVAGAERLRPDLWARAAALKAHRGWPCAQQQIACAEVELVHAGHERVQLQWRHAQPYVQIAEDLIAQAQTLADRCEPPVPPSLAVLPPPLPAPPLPPLPPPPPPPAPQPVELTASVVFRFDRDAAADLRGFSRAQLESLVARLRESGLVAQRVQLSGHADRLNGTGQDDYNRRLSERRAATVLALLRGLDLPGLAEAQVSTAAAGDAQPVQACSGRFASAAELQECLLPNRRVDLRITALPARR